MNGFFVLSGREKLKALLCVACSVVFSAGTHASAAPPSHVPPAKGKFAPGQVIVQFKADATEDQIKDAEARATLRPRKQVKTRAMEKKGQRGLTVADTTLPVEETIERLKDHPAVDFVEPNWIYRHQATANDPYVTGGQLWGMQGNAFGSQASQAWAANVTGTNGVYIGIIDEGVHWQHADLRPNVWTNQFDPADGLDNDGNGYADDNHGWNFLDSDNQLYTSGRDGHGTHVAGTIAALGGNGQGVAGVNWRVTYIPAKFLGPDGGYTSDAVMAIDYFVDLKERHGLNIVAINNSWGGGGYSRALNDAVLRAAKAGILFVVAAGNGDENYVGLNNDVVADYPANFDTTVKTLSESSAGYNAVISVAAIDRNGALATFSNYGSNKVHIAAPGVEILSTIPGGYGWSDGTSMATPHVTGAIALYASTHPGATASEIRQAILNAATPTPSVAGKTKTGGRLNVGTVALPELTSNVAATAPRLGSPRRVGNELRVSIAGAAGQRYEVQASSDLKSWTSIGTVTNVTGSVEFSDPLSGSQKLYRALVR